MLKAEWFRLYMIQGICCFCKKKFRKREKKYKFCSLVCSNRYNLNGLSKVLLPNQNTDLAEFIGICLGDGYVSKYQTAIKLNSVSDKNYIPYVLNLITKLFQGAGISLMSNRYENSTDIRINSKIVAEFLKKMGIIPKAKIIPIWILSDARYMQACIRGLIDTEGSISFKKYFSKNGIKIYKQLNFRNYDIKIMKFVRNNLISIGLNPTMTLKKSLYLSNDKSISIYRDKIGFNNPKLLSRSLICNINDYKNLT